VLVPHHSCSDRNRKATPALPSPATPSLAQPGPTALGLSKVQSVDQRMRLECGVGFRQLRTCRRTRLGQLCADFVAKVENRTTLKISRKLIFRPLRCCVLLSATTEVRDRFWINRYGPSRRRAQNATAALRIFVRHSKKTFATKSANIRHAGIGRTTSRPPQLLRLFLFKLFRQVLHQRRQPLLCLRIPRLSRKSAALFQTPKQLFSVTAFLHIRSAPQLSTKERRNCSELILLLLKFCDFPVSLP
jgi:hypothetical protein